MAVTEIKRVGSYLPVDEDGFIVKIASVDKIQDKWKPVIAETVDAYRKHFSDSLLSVYIRGSVAKGEAVDGLSDLDTIAIIELPKAEINTKWGDRFSDEMVRKYPFVEKVEILAGTRAQALDRNRAVHIMLKTQAICVYGEDISSAIQPIKVGPEACQHFQSIQNELQDTINFFELGWSESVDQSTAKCVWIMKRVRDLSS